MKLNSKSLLAGFYRWTYRDLPKDFCTLFWNTLWAVLFLPLHWILTVMDNEGVLIKRIIGGAFTQGVLFFLATVGVKILNVLFGWPLNFFMLLPGLIAVALVLGAVIGSIAGIHNIMKYLLRNRRPRRGPSFIETVSASYGAVRNKYCTKIEWTENESWTPATDDLENQYK